MASHMRHARPGTVLCPYFYLFTASDLYIVPKFASLHRFSAAIHCCSEPDMLPLSGKLLVTGTSVVFRTR